MALLIGTNLDFLNVRNIRNYYIWPTYPVWAKLAQMKHNLVHLPPPPHRKGYLQHHIKIDQVWSKINECCMHFPVNLAADIVFAYIIMGGFTIVF